MAKRIGVTAPLDGTDLPTVRVDADDAEARLLVGFLGSDLQGSLTETRELIDRIDAAPREGVPEWSQRGNSFLIRLKPGEATLLNFDAEDGELDFAAFPLAEFRQALVDWLAALERIAGGPR